MTTPTRRRVSGHGLMAEVPADWEQECAAVLGDEALVLLGPEGVRGPRPRLSVRFATADEAPAPEESAGLVAGSVASSGAREWDRLRRRFPQAVLANRDVWPHPVWGDGVLLQTARLEAGAALAHDCFVFGSGSVRVEVDCALGDLLGLEEDLADIVAHLQPAA